ncbi:F-box/LRR-repeat protein At3g26922-like [Curcuma longa]|uniref:F-box/LRR-repeat protein At3g26922-like n=1 Tax=Curcuma longa TaxID=136217 RepID=UPI003D9DEC45
MDDCNNFDRCPDDVVVEHILSRLPVSDLVRFGAISRRWRNQWASVRSLNFTPDPYSNLLNNPEAFDGAFTGVLNRLQSELPTNLIRCSIALPLRINSIVLSRWLSLLQGRSVRDLVVLCPTGDVFLCSFLSVIPSLEHFELAGQVKVHLSASPDDPFLPHLRSVALRGVMMSRETLELFQSKCPALERLSLDRCIFTRQTLRIVHAPRLSHLAVLNTSLQGIEIAAPALTTLEMHGVAMGRQVVLNVPSLRFLTSSSAIGNTKYFFFSSILETIQFDCGSIAFSNLRRLSIRIDMSNTIEAVVFASALRACLLLKELRLTDSALSYRQRRFWEKQNFFDCLSWHLEYVSIANYSERCSELDFVQFLAREALVLKKLVIWRSRNSSENARAGEVQFKATASSLTNAASSCLDVVWN